MGFKRYDGGWVMYSAGNVGQCVIDNIVEDQPKSDIGLMDLVSHPQMRLKKNL